MKPVLITLCVALLSSCGGSTDEHKVRARECTQSTNSGTTTFVCTEVDPSVAQGTVYDDRRDPAYNGTTAIPN